MLLSWTIKVRMQVPPLPPVFREDASHGIDIITELWTEISDWRKSFDCNFVLLLPSLLFYCVHLLVVENLFHYWAMQRSQKSNKKKSLPLINATRRFLSHLSQYREVIPPQRLLLLLHLLRNYHDICRLLIVILYPLHRTKYHAPRALHFSPNLHRHIIDFNLPGFVKPNKITSPPRKRTDFFTIRSIILLTVLFLINI